MVRSALEIFVLEKREKNVLTKRDRSQADRVAGKNLHNWAMTPPKYSA